MHDFIIINLGNFCIVESVINEILERKVNDISYMKEQTEMSIAPNHLLRKIEINLKC